MRTSLKAGGLVSLFLAAAIGVSAPTVAESDFDKIEIRLPLGVLIINSNSIFQANPPSQSGLAAKFLMHVTAYSSSADETDSTPYLTASGTNTRDGVVASNVFPLGTQIRIPELFGDKTFTVEDRMHERFSDRIDIWMPSKWRAIHFGKKQAEVEIVEL